MMYSILFFSLISTLISSFLRFQLNSSQCADFQGPPHPPNYLKSFLPLSILPSSASVVLSLHPLSPLTLAHCCAALSSPLPSTLPLALPLNQPSPVPLFSLSPPFLFHPLSLLTLRDRMSFQWGTEDGLGGSTR